MLLVCPSIRGHKSNGIGAYCFMPKGYRPYVPEQDFLMPLSLREWLPEGHLAYFVSEIVDALDLAIHAVYEKEQPRPAAV